VKLFPRAAACLSLLLAGTPCCAAPPGAARASATREGFVRDMLWEKLVAMPEGERPPVGVALSGGGARGFAHTGVLEALNYAGFPIDRISGTSMGSVIGGFYASGMTIDRIWDFGRRTSELKLDRDFGGFSLLKLLLTEQLISPKYITQVIEDNLGGRDFSGLKTPFACVAMDFRTGEKIVFYEGPLAIAVRASVNLPGIFAPVEYRHRYLVDGGVVDFIPIDAARSIGAEWVLASVTENSVDEMPSNVLLSLLQVIDIRGSILAEGQEKGADFVVKPRAGGIKVADFERCAEAGELGRAAARESMDAARNAYILRSAGALLERI
jgi:NTE family protein